jgi:hypothetical protein
VNSLKEKIETFTNEGITWLDKEEKYKIQYWPTRRYGVWDSEEH